jgi:hypothetical protein
VAAQLFDGLGCSALVTRNDVAPLLGIELLRQRRRADQVAEEHGQLAALASRQRGFGLGGWRRDGGRCRHGSQPLTAAAAELLAGLVRCPARGAPSSERGTAFRAEAALGAVVVVAGRAAHRVSCRTPRLPHPARTAEGARCCERTIGDRHQRGPRCRPSGKACTVSGSARPRMASSAWGTNAARRRPLRSQYSTRGSGRGCLPRARGSSCPQCGRGDRHTRHPATHVTPCYPAVHNVDSSFSHHRAREVRA